MQPAMMPRSPSDGALPGDPGVRAEVVLVELHVKLTRDMH